MDELSEVKSGRYKNSIQNLDIIETHATQVERCMCYIALFFVKLDVQIYVMQILTRNKQRTNLKNYIHKSLVQ